MRTGNIECLLVYWICKGGMIWHSAMNFQTIFLIKWYFDLIWNKTVLNTREDLPWLELEVLVSKLSLIGEKYQMIRSWPKRNYWTTNYKLSNRKNLFSLPFIMYYTYTHIHIFHNKTFKRQAIRKISLTGGFYYNDFFYSLH
jgi:hypothetical protein